MDRGPRVRLAWSCERLHPIRCAVLGLSTGALTAKNATRLRAGLRKGLAALYRCGFAPGNVIQGREPTASGVARHVSRVRSGTSVRSPRHLRKAGTCPAPQGTAAPAVRVGAPVRVVAQQDGVGQVLPRRDTPVARDSAPDHRFRNVSRSRASGPGRLALAPGPDRSVSGVSWRRRWAGEPDGLADRNREFRWSPVRVPSFHVRAPRTAREAGGHTNERRNDGRRR